MQARQIVQSFRSGHETTLLYTIGQYSIGQLEAAIQEAFHMITHHAVQQDEVPMLLIYFGVLLRQYQALQIPPSLKIGHFIFTL